MNNFLKVVALAGLAVMVACQGDKTRPDDETSGSSSASRAPSTGSADSSIVGQPSATQPGAGGRQPGGNVFYFEFDSSDLKPEAAQLAEAWAQYLAANPGTKARLEGHADERGTREYNVGLGERRANAVLQAFTSRGVSERQVSVSSFGEERPVNLGHDEAAWTQNRRVEIVQ